MRRIGQLIIVALLIVSGCAGETAAGAPVSDALRRDAASYAQAHDVPLDEAIRRLKQQDPVGELNAVLQEQETGVFGGLWFYALRDGVWHYVEMGVFE